jgi:hypothetical protein
MYTKFKLTSLNLGQVELNLAQIELKYIFFKNSKNSQNHQNLPF